METNISAPNILVVSSLFFTTNVLSAFYKEYYLYSFLFFILTITSLTVHHTNNIYTNIIDKIAVLSIILYGGCLLCSKLNTSNWINLFVIILTFLLCLHLYVYGFIVKQYCFCNEKDVAQRYHFSMHIISSVGHHFIIYL